MQNCAVSALLELDKIKTYVPSNLTKMGGIVSKNGRSILLNESGGEYLAGYITDIVYLWCSTPLYNAFQYNRSIGNAISRCAGIGPCFMFILKWKYHKEFVVSGTIFVTKIQPLYTHELYFCMYLTFDAETITPVFRTNQFHQRSNYIVDLKSKTNNIISIVINNIRYLDSW